MDKYYTKVNLGNWPWQIDYTTGTMLMGSCFSENIGAKLVYYKFPVDQNPFGIIYNPLTVAHSLKMALSGREYIKNDLFYHGGLYGSFDHHGRFSSTEEKDALLKMNEQLQKARCFLQKADFLIVTFGTAWVYRLRGSGRLVANCHRFPSSTFTRERLTSSAISNAMNEVLEQLTTVNPSIKVIFTVSPVRHWKDGAVENQLSKAILLLAVDAIIKHWNDGRCRYFPAYEIVMDELRDYRFYAPDLVHLNQMGMDHIWDKFQSLLFSEEVQQQMRVVGSVRKASEHRPFNRNTDAYQKFVQNNLKKIAEIAYKYPYINLMSEKVHFDEELADIQV